MPPQSASLFDFDFYAPLPIQVEVSDAPLTSDAGARRVCRCLFHTSKLFFAL
jgi:hypothetical protein